MFLMTFPQCVRSETILREINLSKLLTSPEFQFCLILTLISRSDRKSPKLIKKKSKTIQSW